MVRAKLKTTVGEKRVAWAVASLFLCLGAAWAAGCVYDAIVRARPAWALWIPEAPILNRPELQLIVIVPLSMILVIALIGGIRSSRTILGKLAVVISVLAILQSGFLALRDIHDMAVLNRWAALYYAAQQVQAERPLNRSEHPVDRPGISQ